MNPASQREQGSEDSPANTGLECMNTSEWSGAEGPSPEQWTGNNNGEEQDKLAGRRKPDSNDTQALPAQPYGSTATETLLKGQPKGGGQEFRTPRQVMGHEGDRGTRQPCLPVFFLLGLVSGDVYFQP